MNYFSYPRIHFSGTFKANPSTINNTPNNYDPLIYPTPNELDHVELYWNPRGDGGFSLMEDCVVTQVDYADGTSATTADQDAIIGQPIKTVYKPSFPLQSVMVDLDPMQQNVSEIWAMVLQIGGDSANLTGNVPNVAFNGIWGQCQGQNAPRSSASGSSVFQAKMNNVVQTGGSGNSRFLDYFEQNPTSYLSLNINTNGHNNSPPSYGFNPSSFDAMKSAGVPPSVLTKIAPMQDLFQNSDDNGKPVNPGNIPTELFVKYMLQQYLTTDEFNTNIDVILSTTVLPYTKITPYDFLYGMITGTVGPSTENQAHYFVPSRVLVPTTKSNSFYAPFVIDNSGMITLNLGNSLPTETPGNDIYAEKLETLWLVAFPNGDISQDNAKKLIEIPYNTKEFYANAAGFFQGTLGGDLSKTPLGLLSSNTNLPDTILLAEDKNGYFLRANQFVYRMNPSYDTTDDFPRGKTNTIHIHALQFGEPVADGTEISLTMKTEADAEAYTVQTLGTGGTKGIKNLSIPQDALSFSNVAKTVNGVATFDIACKAPGNPRNYVDGQVYFLDYNFKNTPVEKDINDIVSVMVYDEVVADEATDVLAKFGRLYKIMGFLADEEKIKEIDMRNMIKTLLQRPMTNLVHMPATRDLSAAARTKIVDWVDALNNS